MPVHAWLRISPFAVVLLSLIALLAACDDDGASNGAQDADPAADPAAAATAEALNLPAEGGLEPVFWRTEDAFQSLVEGEPYKVVVRVTSGYADETLAITATREDGEDVALTANRVDVASAEGPGTFYTLQLVLPEAGSWQLATAAAEEVTVTVDVNAASP